MLQAIGAGSMEALFDEIPGALRGGGLSGVPAALTEMEVSRLMRTRAETDGTYLNFIGAGAYEHHIPAAVWQIATRGEFYTSYTPYQAEASQGTLQVLYEFQSMMAALLALEATNASLYDGASALAEAVLMAVRIQRGAKRVLLPRSVHPVWRRVARTITRNQGIELIEAGYDAGAGHTDPAGLAAFKAGDLAAVVVPQPNYFGVLEPVDELVDWAHARGALAIAAVNPVATAILKPPGHWGSSGADIAIGEGQPLGVPLASGGPYFGFMACRKSMVRQMPGRIVGATRDAAGRRGYTLTLQAREQHIRRSKATSNICTNQGLVVTAATIHLALLGADGLARVARASHANATALRAALARIDGVEPVFSGARFHEFVLRLATPVVPVLEALRARGIIGGLALGGDFPELGEALLVCATETKTPEDIQRYAESMDGIIAPRARPAPGAVRPNP